MENFFFLHSIVPSSSPAQCALLRSQGGPFSSPFSPLPFTCGSVRCSFAFFSSVVFVFLFFRLVPAGVAVLSTSLATTEQRARLRHASGVRLELVSPPTSSCGTWTWLLWVVLTVVALKWSQRSKPTLAKPTLAKPTLANAKVFVVCKDFGFGELIVWVF